MTPDNPTFEIPGTPVAWARSRHRGKRHFPAPGQEAWQIRVLAAAWSQAWQGAPPGPIGVLVVAVYARPTRRPDSVTREAWGRNGRLWKPTRPDVDNVLKGTLDALQVPFRAKAGRSWLDDDGRVSAAPAIKVWGAPGEPARTLVWVGHPVEVMRVGLDVALTVVEL